MKTGKSDRVVILAVIAILVATVVMTTIDVFKSGNVVGLQTWGIVLGIFGLGFCLFMNKMANSLLKEIRRSKE